MTSTSASQMASLALVLASRVEVTSVQLRTLASTEMRRGGPLAVGGEASWTSGEQDVLTLLDVLAPREAWARWMWPLPCGWNWQVWDETLPLPLTLAVALTNWQVCDGTLPLTQP